MNRTACICCVLSASVLNAASIKLAWTPSSSSKMSDAGTVNVYRVTAPCPQIVRSVKWLHLATGVPADGPYIDNAANPLYPHCYYVTAVIDGKESAPSNLTFIPAAPSLASGVWQK